MRALVTRLGSDGRREKVLVTDWPEFEAPVGNQIRTQTICTAITNGTERNDLLSGNYALPAEELPAIRGYQNVGRVIAVSPAVSALCVGDLVYVGSTRGVGDRYVGHVEFVVIAEDGLLVKLPDGVNPIHVLH
jgi:threonine dehydrogenase-like Zn-dependent dehydrogenase